MTKIVHTDAFTQRDANTQGCFYTRVLLFSQRHAFTHRRLHIQKLLRGDDFTRNYPLRTGALHRDAFIQELLHTDRYFYTQMPLHSIAFTQRSFYTHALVRRKPFDTEYPLHR